MSKRWLFFIINISISAIIFTEIYYIKNLPNSSYVFCYIFLVLFDLFLIIDILSIKFYEKLFYKKYYLFIKLSIFIFLILMYLILSNYLSSVFNSFESLKEFILKSKKIYFISFILVNYLITIFFSTNSIFLIILTSYLFNPFQSFIISFIGIITGELTLYFFGKIYGYKFITNFIGYNFAIKCSLLVNKKENLILPVVYLLPYCPCNYFSLLIGNSFVPFKNFLKYLLVFKSLNLLFISYFLSGFLIPFTKIGFNFMIILFMIILIIILFIFKYQDFIYNKFLK